MIPGLRLGDWVEVPLGEIWSPGEECFRHGMVSVVLDMLDLWGLWDLRVQVSSRQMEKGRWSSAESSELEFISID